ncbi:MAG: hypothetical protein B7Y88_13815 [Sphingomonadales bacterium 32-64-17]|nr:MAG: hypothetical protein B7Y88_13815 [Sphingomonadales bacterium 32-64-17]
MIMTMQWAPISRQLLEQYWRAEMAFDPRRAEQERVWWESLSAAQLRRERMAAWLRNDKEAYCLAASYFAFEEAEGRGLKRPATRLRDCGART